MLHDIYKVAIRFGMSKREYFRSTPNDVLMYIDVMADKEKEKRDFESELIDYRAWLHGLYVARAVASVMSKKVHYPKQPLSKEAEKHIVVTEDMSESRKKEIADIFFGQLGEMQAKFEASKSTGEG